MLRQSIHLLTVNLGPDCNQSKRGTQCAVIPEHGFSSMPSVSVPPQRAMYSYHHLQPYPILNVSRTYGLYMHSLEVAPYGTHSSHLQQCCLMV